MNRKKLNRWISIIGAAAIAMTGFSGCQSNKTEEKAETADSKAANDTKETSENKDTGSEEGFTPALDTEAEGTLEIAGFMGNFEALDQVVNNFNEYYPNITVSYEQNSAGQIVDYLENNDYVDIFMTSESNLSYPDDMEAYAADYCLDLSKEDIDLSAIRDEMVECGTVDGKLLRIPLMQNTFGMVVNETLLENEGLDVPTNYEEFLEVLKELKSKGYTPIQGSKIHVYSEFVANMALSQIGTDDELREKLNNGDGAAAEALLPAYQKLGEMIENGYTDAAVNDTYPEDNYDGAILKFFEGDVPFWICSTESVSGMKKRESKSETFTKNPFDYQFVYIPLGDEGGYEYMESWSGFSVNKDSDNKDYAVEFMRFLATEEQLNTIASVKGMPSVAKNSSDEKYAGIENDDLIERSYIDKGEIKNSVKSSVANVGNQFGNGNYENADEAVANLEKRISEQ